MKTKLNVLACSAMLIATQGAAAQQAAPRQATAQPAAVPPATAPYTPPKKRIAPMDGLVAQAQPSGETPRLADGHPDLSGIWGGDRSWNSPFTFGPRSLATFEPDQTVLQRGSHWNRPIYKPEFWEKVYNLDYGKVTDDPAFHCMPEGLPRLGAPGKIVQNGKELVLINMSYGMEVRFVPTDNRKRDDIDRDFDNFGGVPIGHWEGDTLVVESVGFTDQTWLAWFGYFHSNTMSLQERFTRKGNLLYYSFTVTDPEVLVQPWKSETFIKRLNADPLARMDESPPCKENDADQLADPYYRG